MTLSAELRSILEETGAKLIGFGDMSSALDSPFSAGALVSRFPVGVAVAIPLPVNIVRGIADGPTKEYLDTYQKMNGQLDHIVECGAEFLQKQGFRALAQTCEYVSAQALQGNFIPHKTVATRAGIGWIGKSCLLVTEKYGSAIRLSSILTDAPLETDTPIDQSKCGGCRRCCEACPAGALTGKLWDVTVTREEMLDSQACRDKQYELMQKRTGIHTGLCGKCFEVCPYTRR